MEKTHGITKTVLILEDNPRVLTRIAMVLERLSGSLGIVFRPVSFPTYREAQDYLDMHGRSFDLILLDRNDRDGQSYHELGLEREGAGKIISISSVPERNEEAKRRGIRKSVLKDYADLEGFAAGLETLIREMI